MKFINVNKKIIISLSCIIIILLLSFICFNKNQENKKELILTQNFNNIKNIFNNQNISNGNFKSVVLDNKEYLNNSTIYSNNYVLGELSINDINSKKFSIVNIGEQNNKIFLKEYKNNDNSYIVCTNNTINILSYNYYKQLYKTIINNISKEDLKKEVNNSYSVQLENKNFIKDILKYYNITNTQKETIEYSCVLEGKNITQQFFKINYYKDNKIKTLEYNAKIDDINSIPQKQKQIKIKEQKGDIKKLIDNSTRIIKN